MWRMAALSGVVWMGCGDNDRDVIELPNPSPVATDFWGLTIVEVGDNVVVGSPSASYQGLSDAGYAELRDGRTGALIRALPPLAPRTSGGFPRGVLDLGDRFVLGGLLGGTVTLHDSATGEVITYLTPRSDRWVDVQLLGEQIAVISYDDALVAGRVALFDTHGSPGPVLSSPTTNDHFAQSITSTDNRIILGAPYSTEAGEARAGAVYVYDRAGALVTKLTASVPTTESYFGEHVLGIGDRFAVEDLSGTTSLYDEAGARIAIENVVGDMSVIGPNFAVAQLYTDPGTVWLFDGRTGEQLRRIDNPDPAGQLFGRITPLANGNFVIAADLTPAHGLADAGTAYLYDPTGALISELVPPTRNAGDSFGATITAVSDVIAVCASSAEIGGRVWLFSATDGTLVGEVLNPEPDVDDGFGYLALVPLAYRFAVGAIDDKVNGVEEAGTVYLFPRSVLAR